MSQDQTTSEAARSQVVYIVNQQSLVYQFKCDLQCAMQVMLVTRGGHLHQRLQEHNNASSSIGKHFPVKHSYAAKDITNNFATLRNARTSLTVSFMNCFFY